MDPGITAINSKHDAIKLSSYLCVVAKLNAVEKNVAKQIHVINSWLRYAPMRHSCYQIKPRMALHGNATGLAIGQTRTCNAMGQGRNGEQGETGTLCNHTELVKVLTQPQLSSLIR